MESKSFYFQDETSVKRELVKELQNRMSSHFLEHAMYNINDALTSILALCDMEQMKTVPKIKQYIQKVNSLLGDVKIYENTTLFNANHVVQNVTDIIEDNFRGKSKIIRDFSLIRGFVESDQKKLEEMLLYLLVEFMTSDAAGHSEPVVVSLHQKESDMRIVIMKDSYSFSLSALKEFNRMRGEFGKGVVQMSPYKEGVEVNIRLPLT
ncbi:hypothetical protein JXA05_02010, partial [Candidatus Peregrinibacteria bacterium]|nr:hypothetical protein [Candidatus Peregrinibacteria bacterium]